MARPSSRTLPPRLAAVVTWIPPGSRLADIGSDHGLLPAALIAAENVEFCLATELNADRAAKIHRTGGGSNDRLVVRVGDGLAPIRAEDRVDVVTVCGLGGQTMTELLQRGSSHLEGVRRLVLQPQSHHARVRAAVEQLRFGIVGEAIVSDRGRLYTVICADSDGPRLAESHDLAVARGLVVDDLLHVGPQLLRAGCPLLSAYWRWQETRLARLAADRSVSSVREDLARARRILEAIGYTAGASSSGPSRNPETSQR
ncbi:MAG: class I SAM-dependent methyltransferase [Acidobacteriota bacterium]|nr:class I SAM-dependent methyltransferase [Acidobacteriota bacterium]